MGGVCAQCEQRQIFRAQRNLFTDGLIVVQFHRIISNEIHTPSGARNGSRSRSDFDQESMKYLKNVRWWQRLTWALNFQVVRWNARLTFGAVWGVFTRWKSQWGNNRNGFMITVTPLTTTTTRHMHRVCLATRAPTSLVCRNHTRVGSRRAVPNVPLPLLSTNQNGTIQTSSPTRQTLWRFFYF